MQCALLGVGAAAWHTVVKVHVSACVRTVYECGNINEVW